MPGVDLTPRPDSSAKMPMVDSLRPKGAVQDPYSSPLASARPTGVAVVALFTFALGIALLVVAAANIFSPTATNGTGYWLAFSTLLLLIVSVGLWQLYQWARLSAIVIYGMASVVSAVLGGLALDTLVAIAITTSIVIYLIIKPVRQTFERSIPTS